MHSEEGILTSRPPGGDISSEKRRAILAERQRLANMSPEAVCDLALKGESARAANVMLLHTPPQRFTGRLREAMGLVERDFRSWTTEKQMHGLAFLAYVSIGLRSCLAQWNLAAHLDQCLLDELAQECLAVAERLGREASDAETALLREWRTKEAVRLRIEGLTEDGARHGASALTEGGLRGYVGSIVEALSGSNLWRIAAARKTDIGNDYAAFLQYAMWVGASFVTTNPALVKITWDLFPEVLDARMDALIDARFSREEASLLLRGGGDPLQAALADLARGITIEVVLENARLLRDVFLVSGGRRAYVCLQVNPERHADASAMIADARYIYTHLEERLKGVPNVVFKLPGTQAGLEAARELTQQGIGVTITVSFGMFQISPFAKVLREGQQLTSYIVVMNGRLAQPVREELNASGVPSGDEGARWAGVAVGKRAYQHLYGPAGSGGLGLEQDKVRLLIASLRDYDDWFPDISELLGVPIITVFPNIRRAFDVHKRDLDLDGVLRPVPEVVLRVLQQSEVFRQAYCLPGDGLSWRPDRPLSLEDVSAVASWPPVRATLRGFIASYRDTVARAQRRLTIFGGEDDETGGCR